MSGDNFNFIYISEILHLPIFNASTGKKIGRIVDLAARTSHVYPKITALIASIHEKDEPVYIPWSLVRLTVFKKHMTVEYPFEAGDQESTESEILLRKTFLDKQIISTSGAKLVRVNDLQLLIDNSSKDNPNLWLVHIDIGFKGLLRRLGWVNFLNPIFHWLFARDINDKFLTWKNVQPTTATNVHGSVILKADSSKLSAIHPADLADILEDLGTDERISLLESISPVTAAATLQEMPMNLRVQIAEALDNEKLAGIVSEMQMDETVDLLDELNRDRREAVFGLLTQDRVAEIQDLTKLSAFSVGSIMNTNFITAKETQTVRDVLKSVKAETKKAELLYYVYVIDDEERLKGLVTLRQLLSSKGTIPISTIMRGNIISVRLDSSIKRMAQQFFKYKFEAIPVVDDDDKLQGIITMRDALDSVFPEVKQAAEG
ncbi:MAG TPA: CBS domain-containing protein [Bacteroidota bacterium]|nr:CBS domain-containing protein [Bacteroidota bacterium]